MLLTNMSGQSCKTVCAQSGFAALALVINIVEALAASYLTALSTSYAANATHTFWQASKLNGMIFAYGWSAVMWAAYFACGFFTIKLLMAATKKFPALEVGRAVQLLALAPWLLVLGFTLCITQMNLGSVAIIGSFVSLIVGQLLAIKFGSK